MPTLAEDAALIARIRALGLELGHPTKTCPFCAVPIRLDALVCKHCEHQVNTEEEVANMVRAYSRESIAKYDAKSRRELIFGAVVVLLLLIAIFMLIRI